MGIQSQPLQTSRDGKTQFSQNVGQAHTVTDANGNLVIQIGKRKDGSYGADFAKTGRSILSGNPNDLAFSTAFDQLKVVQTGIITAKKPANSALYSMQQPHGLGYQPAYVAYINVVSSYFPNPFMQVDISANPTSGLVIESTVFSTDDTNLYLDIRTPQGSGSSANILYTYPVTRAVKYFLLAETAS